MTGYDAHDAARYLAEDRARKRADRDDFARDRARLVHSAALRRLSTKTQVWQSGTDDFVRNRLTHSLEVAQIGRELATALGCNADVVDAACLAHDIGHPPFGHFGESVLDEVAHDIGGFEGNAQTFRLLTRLEAKRHTVDGTPIGLNLTRATLDAASKYPWRRGMGPYPTRKFGVYDDDLPIFTFVRHGAPDDVTCLEAQVMDWADDVAYSVHDVEDGITAGAVDLHRLRDPEQREAVINVAERMYAKDLEPALLEEAFDTLVRDDLPASYDGTRADLAGLKDMTSTLIGRFAAAPEDATRESYGPDPLQRYTARLVVPPRARAQVAVMKAVAAHFIMLSPIRDAELAKQREALEAVLEHFTSRPELLDPMFAEDFAKAGSDGQARRVIIDQVASLTDGRASSLAAHVRGS